MARIILGPDNNVFTANAGDQVFGSGGNDRLTGSPGSEYLSGDAGDDILLGNNGNDRLVGGSESDFISGGAGNDLLYSHDVVVSDFVVERDEYYVGNGSDTVVLRTDYLGGNGSINPGLDSSHAEIYGISSNDRIDLKYAVSSYDISTIGNFIGASGRDTRISYQGNLVAVLDGVISDSQFI